VRALRWGAGVATASSLLSFASMDRKQVGLRLSEAFLAQLDAVRGGVPREAWIRMVLTREVERLIGER